MPCLVDTTIDEDDMIAHFSSFGDVTGISMKSTRGYAFIDYRSNDCVQRALRSLLGVFALGEREGIGADRKSPFKVSYRYICMYVWSSHIAEYGSTG